MAEHHDKPRTVQMQFKHDVTREQIIAALEPIFRLTGCLTCGIRGIDLALLGGDPEAAQIQQLPGVAGVIAR